MGISRFATHTKWIAGAPKAPCFYAAELIGPQGLILKVGVGSNACGRMMSLQSEAKRVHGADISRVAVFTTATVKAAYEAETRVVNELALTHRKFEGRREFFADLSFRKACSVANRNLGPASWTSRRKQPA